jgi:hypothetical protein
MKEWKKTYVDDYRLDNTSHQRDGIQKTFIVLR